jgi:hypothetical protein
MISRDARESCETVTPILPYLAEIRKKTYENCMQIVLLPGRLACNRGQEFSSTAAGEERIFTFTAGTPL